MTKEEFLANKAAEWWKEARRHFIDGYTEEWEIDGWRAEWEKEEQELREQWRKEEPNGTEDDWDSWSCQPFINWRAERQEALRDEAKAEWRDREKEDESEWGEYAKENKNDWLKEFAEYEASEKVWIKRQPGDWKVGSIPLDMLSNPHWDYVSGGVQKASSQPFIYGYVHCTLIDGEISHSGIHGPCPHEIKVCVVKSNNLPVVWKKILEIAGPKPQHTSVQWLTF